MNAQPAPQRLTVLVLGPLEVLVGDEPIALGPPKQRALLVRLAVAESAAVSFDRLIDDLWPERPPPSARQALQVYASGLRKALGDPARLTTTAVGAYKLRLEPDELDLARFRALVAEGRPAEALALWRGPALAGLESEPGMRDVVLELEHERLEARELLVQTELDAGRPAEVVGELERLLGEYPARERLHELLMLALYRSGRQADALAAYQRARRQLRSELGLEPGERLRAVEAAILRRDPELSPQPPELRARLHLPPAPRASAEYERAVEEVAELVASEGVRLVTVVGHADAAGVALSAAERAVASFPGGVWYTEPPEAGDKELLLVATGVDAHAALSLASLLRAAPRLRILATSPRALDLYGEHRYELEPAAS